MGDILLQLAGMTATEIVEADVPSIRSAKGVVAAPGARVRQNIRAAAGMLVGPEDLNEARRKLANHTPRALQKTRGA